MTAAVPPDGARRGSRIVCRLSWSATLVLGSMAYAAPAEAGAFATARYTAEHGHPTTDNATALYFNPGALTRGEGTRLLLDGSLALRSVTWEHPRHPTDDVPAGYEDANVGKATLFNVLAAPTLGIVGKLDALAIGGLIHVPFGGAGQFDQNSRFENDPNFAGPVDGVQRWHNITGSLRSVYFTVGAAYEIGDQFSFGLALNLISSATETTRAKNAAGGRNEIATEGRAALL